MARNPALPSNVVQFPSSEVWTAEEETVAHRGNWGMIEVLSMCHGKALIEGCIPTKTLHSLLLLLGTPGAYLEVDDAGKLIVGHVLA